VQILRCHIKIEGGWHEVFHEGHLSFPKLESCIEGTLCMICQSCGGDGLLAFWNTPDDVPDHAAKACATALAMQDALVELNDEFLARDFPRVSIRVGLHTGSVLSGNIGSSKKMKFGCLGDPVNLASRLEGLCKVFGVRVICSGATHAALQPDGEPPQFLARKLALVQVKGKRDPTWVYEVMGRSLQSSSVEPCGAMAGSSSDHNHDLEAGCGSGYTNFQNCTESSTALEECARLAHGYELALSAFQERRFRDADDSIQEVLRMWPQDVASIKLQERVHQQIQCEDREEFKSSQEELVAWTGAFILTEK